MIEIGAWTQIAAFVVLSLIATGGALGMATTMSMYRSGIFLMASFIGVSGLFVLLSADLLALLQVMMYIGGMLVMILFMVLFSHDPGGDRMAAMDMSPLENFFSLGLEPRGRGREEEHDEPAENDENDGDDMDMSMTTPAKPAAAGAGAIVALVLMALLLLRPAWPEVPVANVLPDPDSARRVGHLLMGKYMIAFEGAGLLILIGIVGATFLARPGAHPSDEGRDVRVATDDDPPDADTEELP